MLRFGSFVFAMAAAIGCCAQETIPSDADATPVAPATATPPPLAAAECCRIASGTLLTLEIMEQLDSSLLKRGDRFRIRLAEPVVIADRTLLAAGTEGVGEVVHAERSRGGGKAGELLIAARHLDHQGNKVPLRGLKMGGAGKDKTNAALALSFAAGPFALFLQGDEIVIPAGSLAEAKVAQDVEFRALQPSGDAATSNAVPTANTAGPQADPATESAVELPTTSPARDAAPAPMPGPPAAQANDVPSTQQPKE